LITDRERYQHVIKVWSDTKNDVTAEMIKDIDPYGSIAQMINSGARGNIGQLTQMAGMKGLVINPAGKIIELPIKANFKEGAEMLEYFISQHGGRKGRSDTALKTASAGYLTRRLVDAVQDIVVREDDCFSKDFVVIDRVKDALLVESFDKRVYGRTLFNDIVDAKGNVLVQSGERVDDKALKIIKENEINSIDIRSVLTCSTKEGVCAKCYGRDLATNKKVVPGTAIGIIAAQSIGEPGTQLTMRTFHMGGVAEGKDITQGLPRVEELFEARAPKNEAPISEVDGKVKISRDGAKLIITIISDKAAEDRYLLIDELESIVSVGEYVKEKQIIAKRKEGRGNIKAKFSGTVKQIKGKEIVIEHGENAVKEYVVSFKDNLRVKDGDYVT
jgi:DNA-directed RNA polymerase subunit beta'